MGGRPLLKLSKCIHPSFSLPHTQDIHPWGLKKRKDIRKHSCLSIDVHTRTHIHTHSEKTERERERDASQDLSLSTATSSHLQEYDIFDTHTGPFSSCCSVISPWQPLPPFLPPPFPPPIAIPLSLPVHPLSSSLFLFFLKNRCCLRYYLCYTNQINGRHSFLKKW